SRRCPAAVRPSPWTASSPGSPRWTRRRARRRVQRGDPGELAVQGDGRTAAGQRLDQADRLLQGSYGGGAPVTLDGEFTRIAALGPAPLIWTGSVGPKSLAVTGRSADGWIPGNAADWHSDRYRSSRPLIDEAARAAGRDPADIATVFNLPARITDSAAVAPRDRSGRWLGGSVAQWITELTEAVLEHGASGFVYFASGDPSGQIGLGRWAEEIVPAVREAVAKG
ncbi:LLM class flavin-dependent oxidoreductase, partial [Streptomyces sanglieri]|uniref:LLM class flavin-dependent oxidoreductase n=1 Tax=Streptomyces sanglieri TaxID=193460 RepID=UPI0035249825